MQDSINDYTALLMHKHRERELVERANEYRLVAIKAEFVRRARRIVRINNS
ncbi:MAG: hypothetical protein KC546_21990 [Anaerolineae bacterium]|nr:hypothetical protein [Anaerolineae bacterium]MCA9891071.1 hypothetical protein [Anaerolineae bacterium]MCA9894823.1 hypothetical protein [Anaerolineae bacterium]MCB9461778.1 hypothetical protein [Anaerolineaceae bacterium]